MRRPTVVRIGTTNSTSGNPRRGWIVDYGKADAYFIDEGYSGWGAAIGHNIPRRKKLERVPS